MAILNRNWHTIYATGELENAIETNCGIVRDKIGALFTDFIPSEDDTDRFHLFKFNEPFRGTLGDLRLYLVQTGVPTLQETVLCDNNECGHDKRDERILIAPLLRNSTFTQGPGTPLRGSNLDVDGQGGQEIHGMVVWATRIDEFNRDQIGSGRLLLFVTDILNDCQMRKIIDVDACRQLPGVGSRALKLQPHPARRFGRNHGVGRSCGRSELVLTNM